MTILLTGATGFIGRHVLNLLLKEGHVVFALSRSLVTHSAGVGRLKTVIGDLASGDGFDQVPWADLDVVVHLAASGVKASRRLWNEGLAVNVVGTQRLLTAISQRATRSPKVFIARTFYEHLTAKMPALLENPYIATKQAGSELALMWAKNYSGNVVVGTFFQVYGPGDDAGNVLSYAARELKACRPATFGSGRGLRDWIYITDAAAAVVAAINTEGKGVNELDIGSGKLVSIRAMIEHLIAVSGVVDAHTIFDAARDRSDNEATATALKLPANWSIRMPIGDGLLNLWRAQEDFV
jgi:nucleoside-diphosphate-sugar epimerase